MQILFRIAGLVIIVLGLHVPGIFKIGALYRISGSVTRRRPAVPGACWCWASPLRWMDTVPWAPSYLEARRHRSPGNRDERHCPSRGLVTGIGRSVPADESRAQSVPVILRSIQTPFPRNGNCKRRSGCYYRPPDHDEQPYHPELASDVPRRLRTWLVSFLPKT